MRGGNVVMLFQAPFWWCQMSNPHFTSGGADIQVFQQIPIPHGGLASASVSGERWEGGRRGASRHSQRGLCLGAREEEKQGNYTTTELASQEK